MKAKKALGQHFLTHGPSIRQIVDTAQIGVDDLVVEIGPGQGALTSQLIETGAQIAAIEIDQGLGSVLKRRFGSDETFALIQRDVLQVDLVGLVRELGFESAILVGNLPYQITGALMRQITDARAIFSRAVIMVQREVGRRIVASPGGKDYGVLSTVAQIRCRPRWVFDLPPEHFAPPPKIHSSVLVLDFEPDPVFDVADEAQFLRLVRTAYQQRRKKLRNTLKALVLPVD